MFRLTQNRVLIEPIFTAKYSSNLIHIPVSVADTKPAVHGTVVGLGPTASLCRSGDTVIFHAGQGHSLVIDNHVVLVINEDELLAIEPASRKFNQSRLTTYQKCQRKYFLNFEEALVPATDPDYFVRGRLAHEVFEAYFSTPAGEDKATHWRIALPNPEPPAAGIDLLADVRAESTVVEGMFEVYRETFPEEEFEIIHPEVSGEVTIGDNKLVFRADGIVAWNKQLWLLEHKTAKVINPQTWLRLHKSIQISAYIYGVQKLLGLTLRGAILTVLKSKPPFTAERQLTFRTPLQLNQFESWFIRLADEIRAKRGAEEFIPHPAECHTFGPCPYIPICHATPNEAGFARSLFVTREPDYTET